MLLALDIGNSAVKAGLFEAETLTHVDAIASPDVDASEQDAAYWQDAFAPLLDDETIERIGLVSVVPARTTAVIDALQGLTSAPITLIRPDLTLPFAVTYDTPDTLGNDRLAAAAAGWVHYGRAEPRSVLVVDAGTAVNYEVVHRDGIYQGGAIGAGPALVRQALRMGTAQLPEVPLTFPPPPVGQSTQTALQSGILWGLVDSVRGMRDRLAQSLPDTPRLVLTGGWSSTLTDHLHGEISHAPHLVLRGVRLLAVQNAQD
ncbi:MAG: type III pantothenate kinase [Salinibacter sp.]